MKRYSVKTIFLFTITVFYAAFYPTDNYAGDGHVSGFADIHIHQMAEYAYAGAWFHGSHKGPENVALKKCNGGDLFGGDHARTKFGPLNEFLGMVPGTNGDTGWHFAKQYGYPFYTGWPRWDSIAHQQVWEGHLKQAHENGLNIYVMSAVDFSSLCNSMPKKNMRPGLKCDEMSSVDVQLQAAIDFAAQRDWVKIARTPEEARTIIKSGKLAMILAIEVTSLFNNDDWRKRLDHYYDHYNVRSIQFAHQLDNRFTGVAPHHFIFKFFKVLNDIGEGDLTPGFDLDKNGLNKLGLTAAGKDLARAMMGKQMIIDISHMSEHAVVNLYAIAKARNYYPMVLSHGHLRSIMMDKKQKEEKTTPDYIIRMIRETGGMIGLRTGPDQVKTYSGSGVPNDCDGSTKSFAQAYQYGTKGLKVPIAFASDFNGFIQQLRPRFGGKNETCGSSNDATIIKSQIAKQTGPVLNSQGNYSELNSQGFGHIGLENDIIRELNNFGVDTTGLENSAESFIRVWERCYDDNRVKLSADDMDTSGVY